MKDSHATFNAAATVIDTFLSAAANPVNLRGEGFR